MGICISQYIGRDCVSEILARIPSWLVRMISKEDYLGQSQGALRVLFEAVEKYRELYQKSMPPIAVLRYGTEAEFEAAYEEWECKPEIIVDREKAAEARVELDGSLFSFQVISGSILQIAYQAIQLYSDPIDVAEEYHSLYSGIEERHRIPSGFVKERIVYGVPVGLVIYAGRNQHNHIDAGSALSRLNRNIFEALAKFESEGTGWINPAFRLDNVHLYSYAANVLSSLGWDSVDAYNADMEILLSEE
jgi:hypothetical protein